MRHTPFRLLIAALFVASLIASTTVCAETQETTISLNEAVAKTLASSPRLEAAAASMRAQEGERRQAGVWKNPEISLTAEDFAGDNTYSGYRRAQTTAQLSQTFDISGKIGGRKAVASEALSASQIDQRIEQVKLISDVQTAYANAVAARERLKMAAEQQELAEKLFGEVSKRVKAAREPQIQNSKAQITLSNAQFAHEKAGREFDHARHVLASYWGGHDKEFNLQTDYFFALTPPMTEQQIETSLRKSLYIEKMEAERKRMKAIHSLEKAQAMPDPTFGIGVRDYRETRDQALVASISIPIPVWDSNGGAIDRARENVNRSTSDIEVTRLDLVNEGHEALENMINAYERANKLRDTILPAAEKAFTQSRSGYGAGKLPYLEVLDAQRTLFDVHDQYIDTLNEYHKNKAVLARLTASNDQMQGISHE